jgi:hypothetical protein
MRRWLERLRTGCQCDGLDARVEQRVTEALGVVNALRGQVDANTATLASLRRGEGIVDQAIRDSRESRPFPLRAVRKDEAS